MTEHIDSISDLAIGKRVRYARRYRNLTQKDLAKELGVSQTAVTLWENGMRSIPISTIAEISEILNAPLTFLICGSSEDLPVKKNSNKVMGVIPFSDDLTEEEIKEVENYIEYLKSKR